MARVLFVEDEAPYRAVVCQALDRCGHQVFAAATAHEAVALGLRHRPDVLVADWMLRHSIHGLHVAEALRLADPALHTVLVTGFPSSDLPIDAARVGIVRTLEKPFDLGVLEATVGEAAEAGIAAEPEVVGVLCVDAEGAIRHRNGAARALLAETKAGEDADVLADVLASEDVLALGEAATRWMRFSAGGSHGTAWWMRVRPLDDGACVVVFCKVSQEWRRDDPRVRTLLGLPHGRETRWEVEERILLVDDSATVCTSFLAQLRGRGCVARASSTHAGAIRLLRSDPAIRVVILDWAMPGEDLRATVAQIRELRPEARLVGTSGEERRREFGELGIDAFLLKPWTVAGELATLLGRAADRRPAGSTREE